MKKLIFTISLILTLSCQPRITNTPETLDKVFEMSEFDIMITTWGGLGGSSEHFFVSKENEDYLLKSKRTGKSHFISQKNIDSLKTFLKLNIKEEVSPIADDFVCPIKQYVKLGTCFYSVSYTYNMGCGNEESIFEDLLNYSELLISY